jgi:hypothetical protein
MLNFRQEIKVRTGNPSNKLTGCSILDNGEILFSEYNLHDNTDRVTLNDSHGNFIRTVLALSPDGGPFFDITSIDTNTVAVSTDTCISIVNIDTHITYTFGNNDHTCYGITHCDGNLYYCSYQEGIRRFALWTGIIQLLEVNTEECSPVYALYIFVQDLYVYIYLYRILFYLEPGYPLSCVTYKYSIVIFIITHCSWT